MATIPPHNDPARLQASLGLPGEQIWDQRLSFHAASGMVLVSVKLSRDRVPCWRIYMRHISETYYHPAIAVPDESYSVQALVASEAPWMFFSLTQWVTIGENTFGEDRGVGRMNLITRESEMWQTAASDSDQFFVSDLVAASADGGTLFATCGFRAPTGVGRVEYAITQFKWDKRSVAQITPLAGVFY